MENLNPPPMIDRIKEMIAFEQGQTKSTLADEDMQEFERVFNSNKSVYEVVCHLFDFAILMNNGGYANWHWLKHIVTLYENSDPTLKYVIVSLSQQLGNSKPRINQVN